MSSKVPSHFFSLRLDALETANAAFGKSQDAPDQLRTFATEIENIAHEYEEHYPSSYILGFAQCLRIYSYVVEWYDAIRKAEANAARFLDAARLHVSELKEAVDGPLHKHYAQFVDAVDQLTTTEDARSLVHWINAVRIPLGAKPVPTRTLNAPAHSKSTLRGKATPTIAFLAFEIDGQAAASTHYVEPKVTHDILIKITVSDWPSSGNALCLEPISIEPPSTYELPKFTFDRPEGHAPYRLEGHGRFVIHAGNAINARPFEFLYSARFEGHGNIESVIITGHRSLLLEGADPTTKPASGYQEIDNAVKRIRTELGKVPTIGQTDIQNALIVCTRLGNLCGQAISDSWFDTTVKEKEFQTEVKKFLKLTTPFSEELEEHPTSGGGITDLSFRQIRIELKADNSKELSLEDCKKHEKQIAHYAIASGKRIGVLCVLDNSTKQEPPTIPNEDFGILEFESGNGTIYIITCIVRGGFSRPSSYN